jgi:hypothetical protein
MSKDTIVKRILKNYLKRNISLLVQQGTVLFAWNRMAVA